MEAHPCILQSDIGGEFDNRVTWIYTKAAQKPKNQVKRMKSTSDKSHSATKLGDKIITTRQSNIVKAKGRSLEH